MSTSRKYHRLAVLAAPVLLVACGERAASDDAALVPATAEPSVTASAPPDDTTAVTPPITFLPTSVVPAVDGETLVLPATPTFVGDRSQFVPGENTYPSVLLEGPQGARMVVLHIPNPDLYPDDVNWRPNGPDAGQVANIKGYGMWTALLATPDNANSAKAAQQLTDSGFLDALRAASDLDDIEHAAGDGWKVLARQQEPPKFGPATEVVYEGLEGAPLSLTLITFRPEEPLTMDQIALLYPHVAAATDDRLCRQHPSLLLDSIVFIDRSTGLIGELSALSAPCAQLTKLADTVTVAAQPPQPSVNAG